MPVVLKLVIMSSKTERCKVILQYFERRRPLKGISMLYLWGWGVTGFGIPRKAI